MTSLPESAAGRQQASWLTYGVGGWVLVMLLLCAVSISRYGASPVERGWHAQNTPAGLVVTSVDGMSAAAGLQVGDRIEAVDGDRRLDRLLISDGMAFRGLMPVSAHYQLLVDRRTQRLTVALDSRAAAKAGQALESFTALFIALVWCAVGVALLASGRAEPMPRLAAAATLAVGLGMMAESRLTALVWAPSPWREWLRFVFPLAPLHLAVGFHFLSRFPESIRVTPAVRVVRGALYAMCAALAVEGPLLDSVLLTASPAVWTSLREWLAPFDRHVSLWTVLIFPLAFLAMMMAVLTRLREVRQPDERARLGWLLWGGGLALGPVFLVTMVTTMADMLGRPGPASSWILLAHLTSAALPVALGYAVMRHRLFDIRVVVRRSLQYALARNALRVLFLIPAGALAYHLVAGRDLPVGQVLREHSLWLGMALAILVGSRYRQALMGWLDRRFFRESYDRERLFMNLLDDLGQLESGSGVSLLVSRELESAFHPASLMIWYREGDLEGLSLSYSSGGTIERTTLPLSSPLVLMAESATGVIDIGPERDLELPEDDQAWLERNRVRHLVPVITTDRFMVGIIMIGSKRSDEEYSSEDRRLLSAVARQIAIGRDNLRLQGRIARDRRVQYEVLSRLDTQGFNLVRECPRCGRCYDGGTRDCETDRVELVLSLPVERTLDGKYRLERRIGKGGMGAVYEASDLRLSRRVAVKIMLGHGLDARDGLRRFEREAQSCARIVHQNVVTVFDFGSVASSGAYLVMELVAGLTLRQQLAGGPLDSAALRRWFGGICDAVAAAHAVGVVHRDLKPENVLMSLPGETVKVVDFGLAKFSAGLASSQTSLTHPGAVMGTVAYMAPEQLVGGMIDQRTDIFSIGVMLQEAVSGLNARSRRAYTELVLEASRGDDDMAPSAEGPPTLRSVVRCATAIDPGRRYQTVLALGAELQQALLALADSAERTTTVDQRRDT